MPASASTFYLKLPVPPELDRSTVRIVALCEAPPENPGEAFYGAAASMYTANMLQAFTSAGVAAADMDALLRASVFCTTAVRTPRKGLTVPHKEILRDSEWLEQELFSFPNLAVILLMGDAAIKAMNAIAKRLDGTRCVPAGSTYKIRKGELFFRSIRVYPSYLPTGKNFLIEKSKQSMVAEDIAGAFRYLRGQSAQPAGKRIAPPRRKRRR